MNIVSEPGAGQMQQQDLVFALAESTGAVYAARTSGLYRSEDGGETWQETATSLRTGGGAFSVTAVIAHGNTVFAGTQGAVLFSNDDGESWQLVQLASPPPNVASLALSPNFDEDGVVAAGTTEDGVFISTDLGLHWTAWNFGLIDHHVYALAFSPGFGVDRIVFAGTESGVFCSNNGGRGWYEMPFPTDAGPVLSLVISPDFVSDGTIYVGAENKGLIISEDYGMTWQHVDGTGEAGVNTICMTAHPVSELWVVLDDRLIYSTDGTRSWQPFSAQIPEGKLAAALLVRQESLLVGFADGEILAIQR